jgi:hypothetical protein
MASAGRADAAGDVPGSTMNQNKAGSRIPRFVKDLQLLQLKYSYGFSEA